MSRGKKRRRGKGKDDVPMISVPKSVVRSCFIVGECSKDEKGYGGGLIIEGIFTNGS